MEFIRPDQPQKERKEDQSVIGIAQITSVWFKRIETLAKVAQTITLAAKAGVRTCCFR